MQKKPLILDDERRSRRLVVRLTIDEKKQLDCYSRSIGISNAEVTRRALMNANIIA